MNAAAGAAAPPRRRCPIPARLADAAVAEATRQAAASPAPSVDEEPAGGASRPKCPPARSLAAPSSSRRRRKTPRGSEGAPPPPARWPSTRSCHIREAIARRRSSSPSGAAVLERGRRARGFTTGGSCKRHHHGTHWRWPAALQPTGRMQRAAARSSVRAGRGASTGRRDASSSPTEPNRPAPPARSVPPTVCDREAARVPRCRGVHDAAEHESSSSPLGTGPRRAAAPAGDLRVFAREVDGAGRRPCAPPARAGPLIIGPRYHHLKHLTRPAAFRTRAADCQASAEDDGSPHTRRRRHCQRPLPPTSARHLRPARRRPLQVRVLSRPVVDRRRRAHDHRVRAAVDPDLTNSHQIDDLSSALSLSMTSLPASISTSIHVWMR